jgi:3-phosphoglycerate kinase
MKLKTLRKLGKGDLSGKLVFLRCDFNVPLKKGRIIEDYKLVTALPTINYLIKAGARIILASHLGDPGGKKDKALSLKPIAEKLAKLLKKPIIFNGQIKGNTLETSKNKLGKGEILLLENLRFEVGEEKNERSFALELARGIDLYINNAFAVSHREHASVSAIQKLLPSYAGLLLEAEIESLEKALRPDKPLIVIIGGAKIKTKLPIIEKFLPIADQILVGGGIANDFLKQLGYEIGHSLASDDQKGGEKLRKLYHKYGNRKIILPLDFVVASDKAGKKKVRVLKTAQIGKDDYIFDLGPETIGFYAGFIKKARTLVWNGPLGWFEHKDFKHSTMAIAQVFAARSGGKAFGVAGGGETVEALKLSKHFDEVDWVSTAGGAMLEYLSGAKLPGLEKLR